LLFQLYEQDVWAKSGVAAWEAALYILLYCVFGTGAVSQGTCRELF
jgi:hypothetical protein